MDRRTALLDRLRTYEPADAREARSLRRVLAFLTWLRAPFDEQADPTHVTVSGIVVDGERVLLHRHRRLGIWLQPGGHVERGELPHDAVLREVREESGLIASHPPEGPRLIHVDVHEGGRGHLHLDLRYLLISPSDAPFEPAEGESQHLGWFDPDQAAARTDVSARAAIEAALRAIACA